MPTTPCAPLLCAFVAAMMLPLAAQSADAPRFELTPFIGYRLGGNFDFTNAAGVDSSADLDPDMSFGIDLGVYRDRNSFYELLYSHQQAGIDSHDPLLASVDVDVDYFQVGGTAIFDSESEHALPFLSLTIGATRLEPRQGAYDSETKFSGSIGGGLRMPINERIAATFGVRGYITVVDSNSEIFCLSDQSGGTCLLKTHGSTFLQGEASLGLTVRF